jgi:hypothetical protein
MRGSQWPSSPVGKTAGAVRSSIERVTHGGVELKLAVEFR